MKQKVKTVGRNCGRRRILGRRERKNKKEKKEGNEREQKIEKTAGRKRGREMNGEICNSVTKEQSDECRNLIYRCLRSFSCKS
jgi:hypothetical protein